MIERPEDRRLLLETFGELALVAGRTVPAVFEAPTHLAALGEADVEATAPELLVDADDAAGVRHGDTVQAQGRTWRVVGIRPDGTGLVSLVLEEV